MVTKNKKNVETAEEVKVDAELEETIDPEEIVLDDDADMPAPETKSYNNSENLVSCTKKFMDLFYDTVNTLPYATILKNADGDQIKLIDLVKYVEAKYKSISLVEMNKIISFIANLDFSHARPIMEIVENKEMHKELWELVK